MSKCRWCEIDRRRMKTTADLLAALARTREADQAARLATALGRRA